MFACNDAYATVAYIKAVVRVTMLPQQHLCYNKRAIAHTCVIVFRWDSWTPTDPATLAEAKEREEEEDQKRSKEFEESNPDFCKQMVDDMKTRSEVRRVIIRQNT